MSLARRLPVDPALPALASLFDLGAIARLAAPSLGLAETGECQVERVKYRPRRNCVIGYRLRGKGHAPSRWRRFSVAMYPGEEARERFERAGREPSMGRGPAGRGAPPVSWLPAIGAVLWPFPRDRKLPALPALCDPRQLRSRMLPPLVEDRWGAAWQVQAARTEVVAYFPEHGCTVRARLRLGERGTTRRRAWTLYGQTRYDDAGAQAFRVMRALWAAADAAPDEAGFARPLAYDPLERILWQEGVPAPTLDRVLGSGVAAAACAPRVARAIAALHRAPLALEPRLTLPRVLEELERARLVVERACPGDATSMDAVAAALRARAGDLDPAARATLHGDLHSKNVLLDARRAWLIDLDRVGAGLPLAELGSLLAELASRDCLAAREPDLAALDALAAEYRARVPWPVPRDEVRWHLAAALLRERAWRAVTSLKPGRLESLPRMLAFAARALESR